MSAIRKLLSVLVLKLHTHILWIIHYTYRHMYIVISKRSDFNYKHAYVYKYLAMILITYKYYCRAKKKPVVIQNNNTGKTNLNCNNFKKITFSD